MILPVGARPSWAVDYLNALVLEHERTTGLPKPAGFQLLLKGKKTSYLLPDS